MNDIPNKSTGPVLNRNRQESLAVASLRNRLLQKALSDAPSEGVAKLVSLAAVEAEAEAWLTSFPLLLFPMLFEEKAQGIRTYVAHQSRLRPEYAQEGPRAGP